MPKLHTLDFLGKLALFTYMSAFTLTPARSKLVASSSSNHVDYGVRDASFPSNLVQNRNSATKVCHSTEEYSSSPSTHTHQLNKQKMSLGSRRCRSLENGEIGVFDAGKYFKGELDGKQKHMNSNKLAIRAYDVHIDSSHTHDVKRGKRLLHGFSCSCRKKSSDVDERAIEKSYSSNRGRMVDLRALDFGEVVVKKPPGKIGQHAPPPGSTTPVHCRSEETVPPKGIKQTKLDLPIFNPSTRKSRANGAVLQNKEKPRFSIEVFGSSPMGKMGMDPSQHRRLLMSCRDFGNKLGDHTQLGTTCKDANAEDEVASDSSSDLFEIHSLSRRHSSMNQKPNT